MAFPLSQSRAGHVGILKMLIKLGVSTEAKDHMRVYTAFPCALGLGCSKATLLISRGPSLAHVNPQVWRESLESCRSRDDFLSSHGSPERNPERVLYLSSSFLLSEPTFALDSKSSWRFSEPKRTPKRRYAQLQPQLFVLKPSYALLQSLKSSWKGYSCLHKNVLECIHHQCLPTILPRH